MNKILHKLYMFLMVILLTGCSSHSVNDTSEMPENVLIVDKELIFANDTETWIGAWYVEDTLYYLTKTITTQKNEVEMLLYSKRGNNEKQAVCKLNDSIYPSVAIGIQGRSYYISARDNGEYYLSIVDENGQEIQSQAVSIEMSEYLKKEICFQGIAIDDGYAVMTAYGSVIIWDSDLNEKGIVLPEWQSEAVKYNVEQDYGFVTGSEGGYVYYRIGNELTLQKIDIAVGMLEEEIEIALPVDASIKSDTSASKRIYSGNENGIFISNGEGIYVYHDDENKLESCIMWDNSTVKVNMEEVMAVSKSASGNLVFATYSISKRQGSIVEVEETSVENVQTLVVGYVYNDIYDANKKNFTSFNSEHGDIQVVGKQYSNLTELHLDLIQGKGPDIIDLHELDIDEYVSKGILEPLDQYLQSSDKLNVEDILPTLRAAMTKDGAIRFLFPSFHMNVLLMNSDVIKDGGMTTEEFLSLTLEGANNYLTEAPAAGLLYYLLPFEIDKYVSWDLKSCSFNSHEFIAFLELLNNADLPKTPEASSMLFDLSTAERILEGNILASYFATVDSLLGYRAVHDAFGDAVKVVGYPTWNGEEVYPIYTNLRWYGINSASTKKDEAWQFIEHYMIEASEACLVGQMFNFSVLSPYFEQQLYPRLSSGSDHAHYRNQYTQSDERIEIKYDYTDEERNAIRHMVESSKIVQMGGDGVIGNIIMEEVGSYFSGDKSAEEVAKIIQSRVSIYMAE